MSSDHERSPKNLAKQGVVMVEVTSRHLDPAEPYNLLTRNKCSGTAFRVSHKGPWALGRSPWELSVWARGPWAPKAESKNAKSKLHFHLV